MAAKTIRSEKLDLRLTAEAKRARCRRQGLASLGERVRP